MWASATEIREQFLATTVAVVTAPALCSNCGASPCYSLCHNSPNYYSPEQEREDSLYNDSLSHDQWFRLAVDQYERVHGVAYCS